MRHESATYYRRVERDKPPTFYYVHGPVLVVSSREDMLRQAIDCDRTRPADAEPAVTRRLRELGAERALFAMWINPRAFDAEVESKVAGAPADRAATVKHFGLYWKALDSIVLSLSPAGRDLNFALGMRARIEELPEAARRLFREASTPSDLWRRFPEQALLAISDRLDSAAFFDVLAGFLTPQGKESMRADLNRQLGSLLGGDLRKEVLPALGPDWGLCVTAPGAKDKSWVPQVIFALARRPHQRDGAARPHAVFFARLRGPPGRLRPQPEPPRAAHCIQDDGGRQARGSLSGRRCARFHPVCSPPTRS